MLYFFSIEVYDDCVLRTKYSNSLISENRFTKPEHLDDLITQLEKRYCKHKNESLVLVSLNRL